MIERLGEANELNMDKDGKDRLVVSQVLQVIRKSELGSMDAGKVYEHMEQEKLQHISFHFEVSSFSH